MIIVIATILFVGLIAYCCWVETEHVRANKHIKKLQGYEKLTDEEKFSIISSVRQHPSFESKKCK